MLEATLQVLKKDGYLALTTTQVAKRAGVSVGTLYQYFPDKASLVVALKVSYFEQMVTAVQSAAREVQGQPLPAAIPALIEGLLKFKRANLDLSIALREPMLALGGEAIARDATRRLVDATAEILRRARPRLTNPEARARVLNAAVEGVLSSVIFQAPREIASPELQRELTRLALAYARA